MYKLTLHRVHDSVKVVEGSESLVLKVDADPKRIVLQIRNAQDSMQQAILKEDIDAQKAAGMQFADAMFGKEQAGKLLEFYGGNVTCVMNICLQYFQGRLAKLIEKAQKK